MVELNYLVAIIYNKEKLEQPPPSWNRSFSRY